MPDGQWYVIPRDMHPATCAGMWSGAYERAERKILTSLFNPASNIIEIGAHIGVVTRSALTKLQAGGRYICIEANPESIPYLKQNVMDSACGKNVLIIEAAIGAPATEGEMQSFFARSSLESGLAAVSHDRDVKGNVDVPVFSLSHVVRTQQIESYSLICDAEGAEILILKDDPGSLEKCEQIAIELHPPVLTGRRETPDDMLHIMKKLGFHCKGSEFNTYHLARPVMV